MDSTRRTALLAAIGAAALPLAPAIAGKAPHGVGQPDGSGEAHRPRGFDGQRKGDLGNGFYENPVLAGDNPDPSILKDGDIYYHVSSSFIYYPGLVIWKSYDLVNWTPVGPALKTPVGSVYAPDLIKHEGRYYIYFPARSQPEHPNKFPMTNYVIYADDIAGPWSEPVDIGIYDQIDPGHVVGEDGKRYVYSSDGRMGQLSDDGLQVIGEKVKAYYGWKYPTDWSVETFALEGPKFLKRDGYFYLFSAEGGTAGPPTSHMVIVARSKSVHGPWENCPHNPILHTYSAKEPWWSRGHGTAVEGPSGDWWMVYHGYENGFRTLGRQMLLEPIEWTADGWPRATGGDLSKPLRKPVGGKAVPHGAAISGPFDAKSLGARYTFFKPGPSYLDRVSFSQGEMTLKGQGKDPTDASPLLINPGDHSYEMSFEAELQDNATCGILLFYHEKAFCGIACNGKRFIRYQLAAEQLSAPLNASAVSKTLHFRVRNRNNVADFFVSLDGQTWVLDSSFEVSGYNHNMEGKYLSLRPGLYAAGEGSVTFKGLTYRAGLIDG